MVILNYSSWICDDMRLNLDCRKKNEQGWNARSFGMKMTIIDNAWSGWTKGDSKKKNLGSVT